MKVIIVGSHLCEDTVNTLKVLKEKGVEVEFFNLSEDLSALKKYLIIEKQKQCMMKLEKMVE